MELKHLTIAVAAALGLSTAAMAQSGDMGKRDAQRGAQTESTTSAPSGMAASEDVRGIQQELQNRGFNPGAIDGVMGPQTKGAIKEFQQAEGLPPTGDLNDKTKSQLKASGSGSSATGTTGSSTRGASSNPNAPATTSSSTQGGMSPATPGSAPRGGSAGSGTTGSATPSTGSSGMSPGTPSSPSPDSTTSPDRKPTTKDKSKDAQNPKP